MVTPFEQFSRQAPKADTLLGPSTLPRFARSPHRAKTKTRRAGGPGKLPRGCSGWQGVSAMGARRAWTTSAKALDFIRRAHPGRKGRGFHPKPDCKHHPSAKAQAKIKVGQRQCPYRLRSVGHFYVVVKTTTSAKALDSIKDAYPGRKGRGFHPKTRDFSAGYVCRGPALLFTQAHPESKRGFQSKP